MHIERNFSDFTKAFLQKGSFFFCIIFFLFSAGEAHANWKYIGPAYYTYETQSPGTSPLYRFFHKQKGVHFYTISEVERNDLIKNQSHTWRYAGPRFHAYKTQKPGTKPVYRFFHKQKGVHFYTISKTERDGIIKNLPHVWRYAGVAYYAYETQSPGTKPVYRFFHKQKGVHFYTISEIEKDGLIAQGFGPDISVGLWSYTRDDLKDNSFRIDANKDYVIKNKSGTTLATIDANTTTRVKYLSDGNLRIYDSVASDIIVNKEILFEPADNNITNMVFDVHKPDSSLDEYRSKIRIRYSDTTKKIWIINELPLELYLWGFGEITATGDDNHDRAMITAARTYAYWKILYSTKHATEGFKIDTTAGDQIYRGYVWEQTYPDIRKAAEVTHGKIMKHNSDVALSPYSSWTDGRTRSFKERWGSTLYPWCQSVSDPYGKHPSKSTTQLESEGNHMVGISAHGSLNLATDHDWSWDRILKYYLKDIVIISAY